jgi:hypothetical protein
MTAGENPHFSSVYFLGKNLESSLCLVWIRRDGMGIIIVAEDHEYTDPDNHVPIDLAETVNITKIGNDVKVSKIYFPHSEPVGILRDYWGGVKGYDFFGERYQEAAKNLPPEVQALFFGEYGIGQKP